MIEDLWPECVQNICLPKDNNIWEATRFCIDNTLPVEMRKHVHGELLCAFQEFGLFNNINWMIGVMPSLIWRSVFIRAGWPIEFLGPEMKPEPKDRFICGKMNISERILHDLRRNFSIHEPVLEKPTIQ
jgi:acyl homoserine lactone synthase